METYILKKVKIKSVLLPFIDDYYIEVINNMKDIHDIKIINDNLIIIGHDQELMNHISKYLISNFIEDMVKSVIIFINLLKDFPIIFRICE